MKSLRAVSLALLLVACQADEFPDGGYHEACATAADCTEPWMCLEWSGFSPDVPTVCTTDCLVDADCPRVVRHHCGDTDQAWCVDGVCGFTPCR